MATGAYLTLVTALINLFSSLFLGVKDPSPYTLSPNEWWGPPELQGNVDDSIKPDPIRFDDEMIKDLRSRLLNHVPLSPPLQGAAFTYGFNTNASNFWINYWANEYNFKEREEFLNKFPQFKTNVQGLDIHFMWVKPDNPNNKEVVPLLLLHGWPGSIREFYEAIPILTADYPENDFVIEVVAPCLPGFGFSAPAVRPGLGGNQMAIVMKNLMSKLGHEKFYIQGGDWGGQVGSAIATIYQDDILGFHSNWALVLAGGVDALVSLVKYLPMLLQEAAYVNLAAAKPDSLGVALTDSPAGLMAFIMEKFGSGVNPETIKLEDGGLHDTFTPEQIIDDLMFYWPSKCITSSLRLYAETLNKKSISLGIETKPTKVPAWVTQGKYELTHQPELIIKHKYTNLLNSNVLETGGHFLALELPKELSESVLAAINGFRKFHRGGKGIIGKIVDNIPFNPFKG